MVATLPFISEFPTPKLKSLAIRFLFLTSFLLLGFYAQAFHLHGMVKNSAGQPLEGAFVWCLLPDTLVATQNDGTFDVSIHQKPQSVLIYAPGFSPKKLNLAYNFNEKLVIYLDSLQTNTYLNPYEVVRLAKAQSQKAATDFTLKQQNQFQRKKFYLTQIPFNLPILNGKLAPAKKDTGLAYSSLSNQKVNFTLEQQQTRTQSFNAAGLVANEFFESHSAEPLNLKNPFLTVPQLQNSKIYSPLHPKALRFYNYQNLGSYTLNNQEILRIGFKPKRHGTACTKGVFEIGTNNFKLYYTQITLTGSQQLNGIDSLVVEQLYHPVSPLPLAQFSRHLYYHKIIGYSGLYEIESWAQLQTDSLVKTQLNAFVFQFDSSAVENVNWEKLQDSSEKQLYQNHPLTLFYKGKYSRVNQATKKLNPTKFVFKRNYYQIENFNIYLKPFYKALGYNTVEGPYLHYQVPIEWHKPKHYWVLLPEVRYGFSDGVFKSRLKSELSHDLKNPKKWHFELGSVVNQFNDYEPISPFMNTFYSLLVGKNHLKLYGKNYGATGYELELFKGLRLNSHLEFASRYSIFNHASLSALSNKEGLTPNNPALSWEGNRPAFKKHQALTFKADFTYRFGQQYWLINGEKRPLKSNTPLLRLNYRQGIPSSISSSQYHFGELGISFTTYAGNAGFTRWDFGGGGFLSRNKVPFIDYKHFNGSRVFYLKKSENELNPIRQFSTLQYYDYSTATSFAEAHLEHHFNGWLLSKWKAGRASHAKGFVGLNYLNNFKKNQYFEVTAGFKNIAKILRLEAAGGFNNRGKFTPSLLLAFDFNLLYYRKLNIH